VGGAKEGPREGVGGGGDHVYDMEVTEVTKRGVLSLALGMEKRNHFTGALGGFSIQFLQSDREKIKHIFEAKSIP